MKKQLANLLFFLPIILFSQTNTFPNSGNVGVGTTNPSSPLEIRSSNNNGMRFNYGNTPSVSFLPNDGDSHFHISHTLDNRLTISQGGSVGSGKLLTVMNDGRVGIGTVNPEEKLHINGTTTIVGDIGIPVASHWVTGNHTLELQNNDAGDVVLSFHRAGYTNAAIKHSPLGGLIFSGSGGYDANHVFLKSNGYMGIGTTSPLEMLHVSAGTSGDAIFRLEADTGNDNESDNPEINFVQDGALVNYFIGIEGDANSKSPGTIANAFIIGTEDSRNIHLINGDQIQMTVKTSGVGIGTTSPDSKLTVKGDIHAEEVKVDLSVPGPDYVFKNDYNLKPLEEVQNYIKANGHLPNIPSATEMEKNGIQLGEMNMKLLEKIEELTLYALQQEKKIKELEFYRKIVPALVEEIEILKTEMDKLKNQK